MRKVLRKSERIKIQGPTALLLRSVVSHLHSTTTTTTKSHAGRHFFLISHPPPDGKRGGNQTPLPHPSPPGPAALFHIRRCNHFLLTPLSRSIQPRALIILLSHHCNSPPGSSTAAPSTISRRKSWLGACCSPRHFLGLWSTWQTPTGCAEHSVPSIQCEC